MGALMTEALINDQTEFVRVLVDYGFPIKDFVTVPQLRDLYRQTVRCENIPSGVSLKIESLGTNKIQL